jgi:hypothetical protein
MGDVENPDIANESNGFVGSDQEVCDGDKGHKCFAQRICWDTNADNRVGGENHDASVECKHKLTCATAIVHTCRTDRLNNNCQDECLTQDPPPPGCDGGGCISKGSDGSCDIPN